jgi:hypothetical protein
MTVQNFGTAFLNCSINLKNEILHPQELNEMFKNIVQDKDLDKLKDL